MFQFSTRDTKIYYERLQVRGGFLEVVVEKVEKIIIIRFGLILRVQVPVVKVELFRGLELRTHWLWYLFPDAVLLHYSLLVHAYHDIGRFDVSVRYSELVDAKEVEEEKLDDVKFQENILQELILQLDVLLEIYEIFIVAHEDVDVVLGGAVVGEHVWLEFVLAECAKNVNFVIVVALIHTVTARNIVIVFNPDSVFTVDKTHGLVTLDLTFTDAVVDLYLERHYLFD
jgi:hypothetical protein